uniref:Uncharacterized protein n=1 Tax=Anguilla anguilla TaxID=7936 RepID=A0A0E9PM95_ANGAN
MSGGDKGKMYWKGFHVSQSEN